ncbi:MAG: hypothetical protein M3O88_06500 [Actinomycetota bacterium]|nr:hypothetical protein [Actinomycetota bacterium]
MATPTATTHGPPTSAGPGPAERSLRVRKRLVALGLVAPGVSWMILFFVIPMVLLGVTSLESGGILSGGFRFTWEFSNYSHVLGVVAAILNVVAQRRRT